MRQMTLVAFLQAQNCTTIPASWRHPEARTDSTGTTLREHLGLARPDIGAWRQ